MISQLKRILTKIYIKLKERTYNGRLKYLFLNNHSNVLIISFSGFSDKPMYNYIRTLRTIKADKLFILDDFACKGSYYWFENGNDKPLLLVNSLLQTLLSRGGYKRIITIGSSKGGTCAIYYGLAFGASDIFAGACQYRIGTYLNTFNHMPIFKAMMGVNAGEKEQSYLDTMMPKCINENKNSNTIIHLLYSKEEHTFQDDIQYLISDLEANNIKHIDTIKNFYDHGEIGGYFSPWIKEELSIIISNG